MKIIALIILMMAVLSTCGQKKGDNTIIVTSNASIKEIKQVLFNNGYTIEGSDTSFFVTTAKQMQTSSVIRLMIARTDTTIIIKGQYKLQVKLLGIDNDFDLVEYAKSKSNLNHEWFGEMDKVARLLGDKVSYIKQ